MRGVNDVACDGCGKAEPQSKRTIVRGGICRMEGSEAVAGFHQSFDYCEDRRSCFLAAAKKVLTVHAKTFADEVKKELSERKKK